MNLIINDHKYPAIKDVDILKHILLELIDIENSPLEVLKVNMNSLFDLIKTFCKYILKLEKLEPLRGFGFSNSFKDKGKGNAERSRLIYKRS